jgi:hypothetical protein
MSSPYLKYILVCALAVPLFSARGVIFLSTADITHNTTAPEGALAGSGWQYEGQWGSFLGTPIASQYFITAKHVGGSVGDTFTYQGASYRTTAYYPDSQTDLAIWKVAADFPDFAPLYTGSDEVGKDLVVIGRGTQRGAEYTLGSTALGWKYGPADHVQRWGENVVSGVANLGTGLGQGLVADFDSAGLPNEAQLSGGDSGGAVFIQENGVWKLAGINYGVLSVSENSSGTPSFSAALYDVRGLYVKSSGAWQQVPATEPSEIPSFFAATRVSSRLDWIDMVAVPEPAAWGVAMGMILLGAAVVKRKQ